MVPYFFQSPDSFSCLFLACAVIIMLLLLLLLLLHLLWLLLLLLLPQHDDNEEDNDKCLQLLHKTFPSGSCFRHPQS